MSAQQWTVRAGPGASQLRPSLPQSNLRHVSTQPQVGMGTPARPPWSGSKECGSQRGRGQVGMVPVYPSLGGNIAWS